MTDKHFAFIMTIALSVIWGAIAHWIFGKWYCTCTASVVSFGMLLYAMSAAILAGRDERRAGR